MKIAACLRPVIQAQIPEVLCIVFECIDRLVSCKITPTVLSSFVSLDLQSSYDDM